MKLKHTVCKPTKYDSYVWIYLNNANLVPRPIVALFMTDLRLFKLKKHFKKKKD